MIYSYRSYQPVIYDQSQAKFQIVIDYLWSRGIDARPVTISNTRPAHLILRPYPIIELINGKTYCGLPRVISWIEQQTQQSNLLSRSIKWSKSHPDTNTPLVTKIERRSRRSSLAYKFNL